MIVTINSLHLFVLPAAAYLIYRFGCWWASLHDDKSADR